MAPWPMHARDVMTPFMAPGSMHARDVMTPFMAPWPMHARDTMMLIDDPVHMTGPGRPLRGITSRYIPP